MQSGPPRSHVDLVTALRAGRYVRMYANERALVLLQNANLMRGMYHHHTQNLTTCIQIHSEQWTKLAGVVSNITQTVLTHMARRCPSMAEIIIIALILKIRYCVGKLDDESVDRLRSVQLPHYNPELNWHRVFEAVIGRVQNHKIIPCPEVSTLVTDVSNSILSALSHNPMLFDRDTCLLSSLYTHPWTDIKIDPATRQNICYGGLTPSTITPENELDILRLECYRDFENGNFQDIATLLLTVQLTTRCSIRMVDHPDQNFVTQQERTDQFSDVQLERITEVTAMDSLYELFQYPRSLQERQPPFLKCEVTLKGVTYSPTLELAIVYFLFGQQHSGLIHQALEDIPHRSRRQLIEQDSLLYKNNLPSR